MRSSCCTSHEVLVPLSPSALGRSLGVRLSWILCVYASIVGAPSFS